MTEEDDNDGDDRMPRDLVTDPGERRDWLEKCRINKLKVIVRITMKILNLLHIRKHFKPNSFTTVLILAAIHRSWQTSENMTSSAFELLIFNSDDNDDDRDVEPEVSCR